MMGGLPFGKSRVWVRAWGWKGHRCRGEEQKEEEAKRTLQPT